MAAVAAPAVAAGGFLAGLGARSALAKSDGGLALSPEETNALRERLLDKARSNTPASLRTTDVPAPGPGLEALPGQVGSATGAATATAPQAAASASSESSLVRMQAELERAMLKPRGERKWIMVIDLRKCIGCHACAIACKMENLLPPGVVYRPVIEQEEGEYPNVTRHWLPRPCMQCDDPPCVPVCPVGATWKRDDGIVVIDYDICIGCRYCIAACPYGARYSDFGEDYTDGTPGGRQPYEEAPSPEYGKHWTRNGGSPVGNARKCQFCIHRLDAGMLPACVTTCIGGATYFGDQNDPDSLVNRLIARGTASGRPMRLKPEQGTEPKVYYLT
jgi:molybdopterin-containing oxidoreductase family iron-sulfur binding subunit